MEEGEEGREGREIQSVGRWGKGGIDMAGIGLISKRDKAYMTCQNYAVNK